ncbi:MAG: 4-alpha-glucanotransferase, partial [Aquificaceae bacterium]
MERRAGVLLPISSLPSDFGIGDLGPEAYNFVDFLALSGNSLWQILPLNPTEEEHGNSPYYSISLFAGNPILISPELLYRDGLIDKGLFKALKMERSNRIDYGEVYKKKELMLQRAFKNFKEDDDFYSFCKEEACWLEAYALFSYIHKRIKSPWWLWEDLPSIKEEGLLREKFAQYLFYRQWRDLKNYANSRGIGIVGDLPIYPAKDSVDVWSNREVFRLEVMAG